MEFLKVNNMFFLLLFCEIAKGHIMKITKKLFVFIILSVFFILGCGKQRVQPPNNYYTPNLQPQRGTYLPQQQTSYQPMRQSNSNSMHHLTAAKNMSELDQQSKNTQPTLIYSYPAGQSSNNLVANIKFKLLNYMNSVRARGTQCGPSAPPVGWNDKLEAAAVAHAIDMQKNNFLGHIGSGTEFDVARKGPGQGSNFYERILHFGYPVQPTELAGEIISYTKFRIVGTQDPEQGFKHAIDNFLRSPKHCSILMNPRFRDTGIAAYRDNEKIYWVIEFAEVRY